jgi:hypothetical protein
VAFRSTGSGRSVFRLAPWFPPQPSDDELELKRDLEYFVEPDEAIAPRTVQS